jgi:hypothetical protein
VQLRGQALKALGSAGHECEVVASFGQSASNLLTDPGRGAGDERG